MADKRKIPGVIKAQAAFYQGAVQGGISMVRCAYCEATGTVAWPMDRHGSPALWCSSRELEFDHVIPESKGGDESLDNIVLACRRCNRRKGDRSVEYLLVRNWEERGFRNYEDAA